MSLQTLRLKRPTLELYHSVNDIAYVSHCTIGIFTELESILKRYGEPLTHRQSKELIALMDKNGDGQVDMDGKS